MQYSLGTDIGSVNAKLALVSQTGDLVYFDSEKIVCGPRIAAASLLDRLKAAYHLEDIVSAGVSGAGRSAIPSALNWAEYSSSLSIASGVLHCHPDARTIVQIGGQSSLVIVLEDGLKKPWKVTSNPLCAAGTGRFMEQQAYRLGISMDEFASLALKCNDNPPRIAARCSVFAKSDLIHLQQKGVQIEAMLYALCESVARMVASLKKGPFVEPIYLVGGVAANRAIVRALEDVLSARNGKHTPVVVPEHYLYMEALGSALLSVGKSAKVEALSESEVTRHYYHLPALKPVADGKPAPIAQIEQACNGYLGVDIGSTSTKAVLIGDRGEILTKHYLMTAGRPIEAVKEVFRKLIELGAGRVTIKGVGVTGSGRYLIGSLIGADMIKNEITAQTRAAQEIDPDADIIEIGGQDSKLVIKRNGIVVDYQMNKACAAGTGSFIDELAEMLSVSVKSGEFADLAFKADYTVDLGTRCASFMAQSVATAQQDGVPLEVITASLANSIAKNYLSKVLGNRKLGERVILTGAVFYNQAVVSAFHDQLEDRVLTVPEHKEISGAIGAALLARETMAGKNSAFKGFQNIIESRPSLSTFTCKGCDNNCTITRMHMQGEKPTFYGSRCDKYDSTLNQARQSTFFDDREKLLFSEYREGGGSGPVVGIPRALLVYDFAPLLIGFLNALDARVVLSSKTTQEIMENAVELSYTDTCFPVKLLHGHVDNLRDADYILYPSAIRLEEKEGDENQKYACPLVQASPYIIRTVMDLEGKLLVPTIDFSLGDDDVIKNFTDVAVRMGFSRRRGRRAALAGIESQKRFALALQELGAKKLQELRASGKLGVVLFARSYMAQDSGANLGIAEKLAQLGVVPVPLDFLPLNSVSPTHYSDRPYWFYESKHIAGAELVRPDPQLFGLALTNFGCGPNSFILNLLADIMGEKPLGQLEIDEHAAEAGIVTRLEAFVDTIGGYARSGKEPSVPQADVYRGTSAQINAGKTLLISRMSPHADAVCAAMQACGARAIVLPEPDESNILYSNRVTSGTECLPYRVTLGDYMRFFYENGSDFGDYEGFGAGSYGPCRLGKYTIEQARILRAIGFDIPIRTTVSNNAYRDINLGSGFQRLAWKGIVAVDFLQRLLWRTRPYEKETGAADSLFAEFLEKISLRIGKREPFDSVLREATAAFKDQTIAGMPRKPLIGINGEIYLRSNSFSNNDLVRECEKVGLEAVVAPMGEWMKYTSYRNLEDAIKFRKTSRILGSYIKKRIQEGDERSVARNYNGFLHTREPSTAELLGFSRQYLSPRCGSEAVLSIGGGIEWMENPGFAGVISVMPHGCMPGGIVAAMAETFSNSYHKPWISLTYDGFQETTNLSRIHSFAEVIRFCGKV